MELKQIAAEHIVATGNGDGRWTDVYVTPFADAQATIAALTEALECALLEKPLPNGEYAHHAACNGDRRKPAGTLGLSCSCRVGRATIAALQARVQELEEWQRIVTGTGTDQESVIRLAAHEYTKAAIQCWKEANEKLTADLTQRTAECDALKLVNDTHMKTVMKLSHVVEQRTADLEEAKQHLHEGEEAYHKVGELNDHLKAELERVRDQFADLRKMVAALPKVEGEIRVEGGKVISVEPIRGADPPLWWRRTIATFEDGLLAKHYSKLLQHRQGMEG